MRFDANTPREQIQQFERAFPTLSLKEIYMIRRVTEDYFGWERLFYISELLGLEPEVKVREVGRKVPRRELAKVA